MLLALAIAVLPSFAADPAVPAASPPANRVWIGVGLGGGIGADDALGGGGGAGVEAGVYLGKEPRRSFGLLARVHESLVAGPLRTVGNVEVQVTYPSGTGPYALVGFTHNHEALAATWLTNPVAVTAGTDEGITHRSGVEVGGGWELAAPFPRVRVLNRLRPAVAVTAHVFPDAGGPTVYAIAEVGLRFGVDGVFTGS